MKLKDVEAEINNLLNCTEDKAFFNKNGDRIIDKITVGGQFANHPYFEKLTEHIHEHLIPVDFFNNQFPLEKNANLSVVSFALHYNRQIVIDNSMEKKYPSYSWIEMTDKFFNEVFEPISKFIQNILGNSKIVYPTKNKLYIINGSEKIKTANWSERHVAFGCGMGSFGLQGAFITEFGCNARLISIVTNKEFEDYSEPLKDIYSNCLYFQDKGCKKCIERCPVQSVTADKRIIEKCFEREYIENKKISLIKYGKEITACGLCMTGLPCSFTNPMQNYKQNSNNQNSTYL